MAAHSTEKGVPLRECGYVGGSGEHTYVEMVRGDNPPEILCTAHLCRGQTGCNNAMRTMGRGGPFCARPECAAWEAMWDAEPAPLLHADGWYLVLASSPGFDVHEMAYMRDASVEARYVVDALFCARRGIDPLSLARTWVGAMRTPLDGSEGVPRWVQMYEERGSSDAAFEAAVDADNVDAILFLLAKDGNRRLGFPLHTRVGARGSVRMLSALLDYVYEHPRWPSGFGFSSSRGMNDIARVAVEHDRDDILHCLAYTYDVWDQYIRDPSWFRTAIEKRKLKAAGWLRIHGAVYLEGDIDHLHYCDMLYDQDRTGNIDLLRWLHVGLPYGASMPCMGECDWMRNNVPQ
jgi:hypothetical protein